MSEMCKKGEGSLYSITKRRVLELIPVLGSQPAGIIKPKTVTRQRRCCDLNPCPTAPESSMITTRLPNHTLTNIQEKQANGLEFRHHFDWDT